MTAVLQRVSSASVRVDGITVGKTDGGMLVLLGVKSGDTERDADLLADKIGKVRIFSDEFGKMNLSIEQVHGSFLVISNFTLLANYKNGNRPDYLNAEKPAEANRLYEYFCERISRYAKVEKGVFGADMKVELLNDGPITLVMDSEKLK